MLDPRSTKYPYHVTLFGPMACLPVLLSLPLRHHEATQLGPTVGIFIALAFLLLAIIIDCSIASTVYRYLSLVENQADMLRAQTIMALNDHGGGDRLPS